MKKYLLIESRDPFESNEVAYCYELATNLVKEGNQVTLFLVQNGVLPARRSSKSNGLQACAQAGVNVLADDFSLRERGIDAARLVSGVNAAKFETVIDQLEAGAKALWH